MSDDIELGDQPVHRKEPKATQKISKEANNENKVLAVCFSGGGIRSGCFSVGVLEELIKDKLLEEDSANQIAEISSVSGGGYATGSLYSMLWSGKNPEAAVKAMTDKFRTNTNYLTRTYSQIVRNGLLGILGIGATILFFLSLAVLFADFLWSEARFVFSDDNGNITTSLTNSTFPIVDSNTTNSLQKWLLDTFYFSSVLEDINKNAYTSSMIFQYTPIIVVVSLVLVFIGIAVAYHISDTCGCLQHFENTWKFIVKKIETCYWIVRLFLFSFFIIFTVIPKMACLAVLIVIVFEVYKYSMFFYARFLIENSNTSSNLLLILASTLITVGYTLVSGIASMRKTLPNSISGIIFMILLSVGTGLLIFFSFIFTAAHFSLWIIYKHIHPIKVDMFGSEAILSYLIKIACGIVILKLCFSSFTSGLIRYLYSSGLRDSFLEEDFKFGEKSKNTTHCQRTIFTFNTCANNLKSSEFQPYSFSTRVSGENESRISNNEIADTKESSVHQSPNENSSEDKSNDSEELLLENEGNVTESVGNFQSEHVKCQSGRSKVLPSVFAGELNINLSEIVSASAAAVSLQMGNTTTGFKILSPLITFIFYTLNFNLGTWITLRNCSIVMIRHVLTIILGVCIGVPLILDTFYSNDLLFRTRFYTLCFLYAIVFIAKLTNSIDSFVSENNSYEKDITEPNFGKKLSFFLFELFSNLHIPLFKVVNLLLLTKQSERSSEQFFITDGGHFDNLGLYWLLSKKCYDVILCFDAGEDTKATLGCLNLCLQMAEKDEIIKSYEVTQDIEEIIPKIRTITDGNYSYESSNLIAQTNHFKITVKKLDDSTTTIWYGKSVLNGDESNNLKLSIREQDEFPNHPTFNQNFTGTMFSHYQQLGKHVAGCVLKSCGIRT